MRKRPSTVAGVGFLLLLVVAATPDPREATARLGAPSAKVREEAARELLALGPDAAPALLDAAAANDPEIRARARALLVLVTDADAAAIRGRHARLAADESLGTPGGLDAGSPSDALLAALLPESAHALAAAARDVAAHALVSRPLVCALARHGDGPALAAVAEFIRDERVAPSTAHAAARELGRRFDAAPDRGESVRSDCCAARTFLAEAMDSAHPATRRAAVALFGALAPSSEVARLASFADGDAGVRAETARVMGDYAASESAARLRRLARDADPSVREAALLALVNVPGVPLPEPAVAAATDESAAVRAASARLLARDVTPETLGVLRALATDDSARVRAAARRALASLRG